jgi:hypothetical protein
MRMMLHLCPRKNRAATACYLPLVFICLLLLTQGACAQVTAIYSDYGGFWTTSTTTMNAVKPDNNHNLLAFTWNGTTFSTGVSDATLTSHSVAFTPQRFRAFPIATVPNTAGGSYFVMLGQLYDGVNNGVNSSPTPFPVSPSGAQLATFLTDGVRGLDLGTGLANIPSGSVLTFQLSSNGISLSAINDGIPDIFVTEEASTGTANPDLFKFVDVNGATVGNVVNVVTSTLPQVGNWTADFYDLTATQTSSSFINQQRPLSYYATDLTTFGITAANYMNAVALVYQPNGTSDPAFLAFNEPSVSVSTQLSLTAQPISYTTGVTISPAPQLQVKDGLSRSIDQSGLPVTASVATGSGTLAGTLTVFTDASGVAVFPNLTYSGTDNLSIKFASTSLDPAVTGNLTPIALPLNWVSFTGTIVQTGVSLQWSTTGEHNTKDFVVQRSRDGSNWQNLGTVAATGSQNSNQYQFTDPTPLKGSSEYRLLQQDLDGNGTYSEIVLLSTTGVPALITIFPNPVTNGQLNLSLPEAALIIVYNSQGEAVLRRQLNAGLHQLDVHYLPKGLYSLLVDKKGYTIEVL